MGVFPKEQEGCFVLGAEKGAVSMVCRSKLEHWIKSQETAQTVSFLEWEDPGFSKVIIRPGGL
jgi:hypothetical protein